MAGLRVVFAELWQVGLGRLKRGRRGAGVVTEPFGTLMEMAAPPLAVYPVLTRAEAIVRWVGDDAVLGAVLGGVFH
jgi:hypothetical protein